MYELPPKSDAIEIVDQAPEREEPHVVFMKHSTSRSMRILLEDEGLTFQDFINKACSDYIKSKQREMLKAESHIDYSDLQLFPHAIYKKPYPNWYYHLQNKDL